jgi:hypothetical protein
MSSETTNQTLDLTVIHTGPLVFRPFALVAYNWVFFAILALTSVFLILCSALSIWLRYRFSTPDILGYVSSHSVEHPYMEIPGGSLAKGTRLAACTVLDW